MRNGDAYKIKSLIRTGSSADEVCNYFRNRYDAEEVKLFIPEVAEVSESETAPKPKKKARKRLTAKE